MGSYEDGWQREVFEALRRECPKQCRTCGRTSCTHYGDQCDLPKTRMLPCEGEDWILKEGLCPECGSEIEEPGFFTAWESIIKKNELAPMKCRKCGHEVKR